MTRKRRVVFAGAGHANIAALRRLAKQRPDAEFILVNDGRKAWYTGALPGLIRREIPPEQAYVDAARLAAQCGAAFIDATFSGFEANVLRLEHGDALPFDLLCLASGAAPRGGVKPIEAFLTRLQGWEAMRAPRLAVIGGGPAGVELALALRIRLGRQAELHIVVPGRVMDGAPAPVRQMVQRRLIQAGIEVSPAHPAGPYEALNAFTPEPALRIRAALQLEDRDDVFAAGDVARFPTPLPRSGAIAVRQGRVLAANIRRALAGEALNPFVPPQATLAILSLDAATAVGWYGTWSWTGWPAMAVKRRLDRAWVEGS